MSSCRICGKPVVLVPSAQERSRKFGGTPAYYTRLFQDHATCTIKKRSQDTVDLIRRLK